MDKLVGDWGVTGTYRDMSGDGMIIGESSFIKQTSITDRIKEDGTLVHIPTQSARGYEETIQGFLSEGRNGFNYYRIRNGDADPVSLNFLKPNGLQGTVIHQTSGLSRQFKIATCPATPNHFEMLIATYGPNWVQQGRQHLIYERFKPGPVQK